MREKIRRSNILINIAVDGTINVNSGTICAEGLSAIIAPEVPVANDEVLLLLWGYYAAGFFPCRIKTAFLLTSL